MFIRVNTLRILRGSVIYQYTQIYTRLQIYRKAVIFVTKNENENGEKRENDKFIN